MLGFLSDIVKIIPTDNTYKNQLRHISGAQRTPEEMAKADEIYSELKRTRFERLRLTAQQREDIPKTANNIYYAPPWSVTKGGNDNSSGFYKNKEGKLGSAYKVMYIAYDDINVTGGGMESSSGAIKTEPKASFVFPLPAAISDAVTTEWENEDGMLKRMAASGGKVSDKIFKEIGSMWRRTMGSLDRHRTEFSHNDFFFKSVGLRDFSFTHTMTPQSEAESLEMKRIVDRIQMQALPRKDGLVRGDEGTMLRRPSDWEIHFLDGDLGINDFLPKIHKCILEGVTVNNTPSGNFQPSRNTYPNSIEIELTFKEQVIRVRQDYDKVGQSGVFNENTNRF